LEKSGIREDVDGENALGKTAIGKNL